MKSPEKIKKIEAVVLYILQSFKDGVDYIKLFKIMYFAQRRFLVTYGKTIMDDTFKARPKGPVPALTYKVVKIVENKEHTAEYPDLKEFAGAIRIKNQMVTSTRHPDNEYLSVMDRKMLDWAIQEYGSMDSDKLSEMTHDAVYEQVKARMEDDPQKDIFTLIDIARSGGASEDMINYIREKQLITRALA